MKRADQRAAVVLKALGEPRRIEILRLLSKGPQSVTDIAAKVDVSQQAVSQHLAVLGQAGIVEARKVGTRSLYAIRPDGFTPAHEFLRSFWEPRLAVLKEQIENEE